MKKALSISLLLIMFCYCFSASRADTLQDSVNALYASRAAIYDSIRHINDSIAVLKNKAAINEFYDSTAVETAKADPLGTIYKDEWKWRGKEWQIHPFMMSILVLIIVVVSFYVVQNTAMLRDSGTDANGNPLPIHERSFSYSRVQLYWWTMIVLTCFVIFFFKTLCLLPLNVTCIILLGLGSVVHIGGRMIDQKDLDDDSIATGSRKQDQRSSKRPFLTDLLTDGSGVSVPRFQSFVFNLVFGIGFISFFAMAMANHLYPLIDFSEWQLALLGVSSATYLGVKATENNSQNSAPDQQRQVETVENAIPGTENNASIEEPTFRNPSDFEQ